MTYGFFLLLFLGIPIFLLAIFHGRRMDRRQWYSLTGLMAVAALYTTPWDNYLVAHRIWWYDPEKISGLLLGYVPLEEYAFFLLQPLMTGILLLALRDRVSGWGEAPGGSNPRIRWAVVVLLGALWLPAVLLLIAGTDPFRYLALQLAWALPPLMLQAAFGADWILAAWRPALTTLGISTFYLIAADVFAIQEGIWTINPEFTLGLNPITGLVFEEAVFFLLTNVLVIAGLTLLEDPRARPRIRGWFQQLFPTAQTSS